VLDVGAGDAWLARQVKNALPPGSNVTCWDANYTAQDIASLADQGMELVMERPAGRFDGVLMLDVIEHVEDDAGFVRSVVDELLVPGGFALVSVPAWSELFTSHDVGLRHHRRYSPASCRKLLQGAGLEVVREGGLFHTLLPVRVGQVLMERARPVKSLDGGIGRWRRGPLLTTVCTRGLMLDGRLSLWLSSRGWALPGLSYWALCRRRRAELLVEALPVL
jgi:methyltransferase family protein